jgi:hypothetical protein
MQSGTKFVGITIIFLCVRKRQNVILECFHGKLYHMSQQFWRQVEKTVR